MNCHSEGGTAFSDLSGTEKSAEKQFDSAHCDSQTERSRSAKMSINERVK